MSLKLFAPNAPCPCGSGKKYKKCCLIKDEESKRQEKLRGYLVDLDTGLVNLLLDYADDFFGPELLEIGWRVFLGDDNELASYIEQESYNQIFYPWYLFCFRPEGEDEEWDDVRFLDNTPRTIASAFAASFGKELSHEEMEYLKALNNERMNFYEVTRVAPEEGLCLKEAETGKEVYVVEKNASRQLRTGTYLYARVVEFRGIHILSTLAPTAFGPRIKLDLDEAFRLIRQSRDVDRDMMMHFVFLQSLRAALIPPGLENSDGEKIVECRLFYEIDSAHEAFKALASLASGMGNKDLLAEATFKKDGRVHAVNIPWIKRKSKEDGLGSGKEVMGIISIDDREMVVDVNSSERATAIMLRISRRMGGKARHLRTEQTDACENLDASPEITAALSEDMMTDELRQALNKIKREYMLRWLDERIPALGMMTPREAARTKKGRERVSILLKDMEFNDSKLTESFHMREYLTEVRDILGLD